ncbi:MAG TPA: SPW repeat protein [Candidatus Angelobacter sp.]|nr:SPW repeat protein [Candidatus Angelobacter sp.]
MNETVPRHDVASANIGNVILGIWVVISPFVLGFSGVENAKWNNIATGGAVALLALSRRAGGGSGVLNILLGGWLIASAFVLQLNGTPFWNNIIIGICIVIVALIGSASTRTPAAPMPPPPNP